MKLMCLRSVLDLENRHAHRPEVLVGRRERREVRVVRHRADRHDHAKRIDRLQASDERCAFCTSAAVYPCAVGRDIGGAHELVAPRRRQMRDGKARRGRALQRERPPRRIARQQPRAPIGFDADQQRVDIARIGLDVRGRIRIGETRELRRIVLGVDALQQRLRLRDQLRILGVFHRPSPRPRAPTRPRRRDSSADCSAGRYRCCTVSVASSPYAGSFGYCSE